jgi:hypothetical protein
MDTEQCFHLYHKSNPKNSYKIKIEASKMSDLLNKLLIDKIYTYCVSSGTEDTLIFIIKYLNHYSTIDEVSPPEQPLIENMTLRELFELEEGIFDTLLNTIDNFQIISNLTKIAEELNMKILTSKLASIICYHSNLYEKKVE